MNCTRRRCQRGSKVRSHYACALQLAQRYDGSYPREVSGGQCQRAPPSAQTLHTQPDLLVTAMKATSALT